MNNINYELKSKTPEELRNLDNLITKIQEGRKEKGDNDKFNKLVLDIVVKNLEIPKVYFWKGIFDEVRKKHFKNNRTTKVNKPYPWTTAETWEDSLTTQLYMSLFH